MSESFHIIKGLEEAGSAQRKPGDKGRARQQPRLCDIPFKYDSPPALLWRVRLVPGLRFTGHTQGMCQPTHEFHHVLYISVSLTHTHRLRNKENEAEKKPRGIYSILLCR